jgi:hypothetical protein
MPLYPPRIILGDTTNPQDPFIASGTWTPSITFATPGDLSVTYGLQTGQWTRVGTLLFLTFNMFTTAFTHTTASGALNITGLPIAVNLVAGTEQATGPCLLAGVTKATYTDFVLRALGAATIMSIMCNGSGVDTTQVLSGDCPTGGTMKIRGSIWYPVA